MCKMEILIALLSWGRYEDDVGQCMENAEHSAPGTVTT